MYFLHRFQTTFFDSKGKCFYIMHGEGKDDYAKLTNLIEVITKMLNQFHVFV